MICTYPVVREDINRIGALDGFVRQVPQRPAGDDSGIVNEDVDVANLLLDLLGHLVDLLPIGDVHQIGVAVVTFGFQLVGGAFQSYEREKGEDKRANITVSHFNSVS